MCAHYIGELFLYGFQGGIAVAGIEVPLGMVRKYRPEGIEIREPEIGRLVDGCGNRSRKGAEFFSTVDGFGRETRISGIHGISSFIQLYLNK